MCRLLGAASPAPVTVETVLGSGQRAVFADMARLHGDGWGTACLDDEGRVRGDRRPTSGVGDTALQTVLTHEPSTARIVHLRLATMGLARTPANTHPFLADGMAFAHNGSLEPAGPVERLVGREQLASLRGTTDSERYFAAIRTLVARGASVFEALVSTVSSLRATYPERSLNALLLTPTELFAVHASEGVPIPHGAFAASGIPADRLPRHHVDAYYLMRTRRGPDGSIVFASSGLDIAGWDAVPPETVTRVDLATLAVRTVPLSAADASRRVA